MARIERLAVLNLSYDSSVDGLVITHSAGRIVVGVDVGRRDPTRDPRKFVTCPAQQNPLTTLGGQERFDTIKQIIRIGCRQVAGVCDPAADQDPRVKPTQLWDMAYQSAFGLPASNRRRSHTGQPK